MASSSRTFRCLMVIAIAVIAVLVLAGCTSVASTSLATSTAGATIAAAPSIGPSSDASPSATASPIAAASADASSGPTASACPPASPSEAPPPGPSASLAPWPSPLALRPPAAPTKVSYVTDTSPDPCVSTSTVTVSWQPQVEAGVRMRIYAVMECLAPATSTGLPCVTSTTTIPPKALVLLRTVEASAGSTSWRFTNGEMAGLGMYGEPATAAYQAVVIEAENSAGTSHFVVAATFKSCYQCVY